MSLCITDYFLPAFTIPLASDSAIVDAFLDYSAASARRSDHETAGTAEARDTSAPSAALPTSSFSTTTTRNTRVLWIDLGIDLRKLYEDAPFPLADVARLWWICHVFAEKSLTTDALGRELGASPILFGHFSTQGCCGHHDFVTA